MLQASESVHFNRIHIKGKLEIPIKSYKDQCREQCEMSSTLETSAINTRSGIFLYISLDIRWTM